MGRASGISAEQIANLNHYRTDFNFSELERLVLEYADRMTQTPVEVPVRCLPVCEIDSPKRN